MNNFVVYLTTYSGDKLPPFYIGSTSMKEFSNGYCGSVVSKKYKEIYQYELKHNRHLFNTEIISIHNNRKDALEAELHEQIKRDVVKSLDYFNMSLAKVNGYFGMCGPRDKLSQETKDKLKQYCWVHNDVEDKRIKKSELYDYESLGYTRGRKQKTYEQKKYLFGKRSLEICNKMKIPKSKEHVEKLANAHKKPIVMFGILYKSQKEFIDKFSKSRSYIMKRVNNPKILDCYIPNKEI
jgi:hypothetical protein